MVNGEKALGKQLRAYRPQFQFCIPVTAAEMPIVTARLSSACEAARRLLPRTCVLLPTFILLAGCSASGAPSLVLFGAFFPAWLLCGSIGIVGAGIARAAFVGLGLSNTLPYQLALCAAIGIITAVLVWLIWFGR